MDRLERSRELHQRVQAYITYADTGQAPAESFDELACALARFQITYCEPISRYYHARGVSPTSLNKADALFAVPTDAFKLMRIATYPPEDDEHVFRTSGTTQGLGARGEHPFRTIATYREAALRWARRMLIPDGGAFYVLILAPAPSEMNDSSLGFMCNLFGDEFGSQVSFLFQNGHWEQESLMRAVEYAQNHNQRVLILGASFAFVHLLDIVNARPLALPRGSRVMQTGGFKGRSREVDAKKLRAQIAYLFDIDPRAVIAEYGMTELSSQAYEGTLRHMLGFGVPSAAPDVFIAPPWMRVTAVDPLTLEPKPRGEPGIARIVDLANVDSAVAVQTLDLVREWEAGFELLGRAPGAIPRGCSLAIEDLLNRELSE